MSPKIDNCSMQSRSHSEELQWESLFALKIRCWHKLSCIWITFQISGSDIHGGMKTKWRCLEKINTNTSCYLWSKMVEGWCFAFCSVATAALHLAEFESTSLLSQTRGSLYFFPLSETTFYILLLLIVIQFKCISQYNLKWLLIFYLFLFKTQ